MNDLYFRMCGDAFDDGYRLDKVISGLSGVQDLFDGTYKGITGKTRISQKERQHFHIKASEFKKGSFLTYFGTIYSVAQVLPGLSVMGPKEVWDLTKLSFDLLLALYKAAHAGKNPKIENSGDGTAIIYENEVHYHYNAPVFQVATSTIKGLRVLDDVLERGQVNSIEIGDDFKNKISLDINQKGMFRAPIVVDKEPQDIMCDLYDFNKYKKSGKVRVYPSQVIEAGNYHFKIIGGQKSEEFILSMTAKEVIVNCLVEYENDPLTASKIGSLLIMDVAQ